jgi:hypothetical protein
MTSLSSSAAPSSARLPAHHDEEPTTHTANDDNNNNLPPLNSWWKQKLLQVQTNDQEFVATIDDALKSLSTYNNEEWFPTITTVGSSSDTTTQQQQQQQQEQPQHDWILDGHKEWRYQYDKTQRLLEELHKEPILFQENCNITGNGNDEGSNNNKDELALWMLGSVGNQEFQFASFEDAFPTTTDDAATAATTAATTDATAEKQKVERGTENGNNKEEIIDNSENQNRNFACFEDAFPTEKEQKEDDYNNNILPTPTPPKEDEEEGDAAAAAFDDMILPSSSSIEFGDFYTAPPSIGGAVISKEKDEESKEGALITKEEEEESKEECPPPRMKTKPEDDKPQTEEKDLEKKLCEGDDAAEEEEIREGKPMITTTDPVAATANMEGEDNTTKEERPSLDHEIENNAEDRKIQTPAPTTADHDNGEDFDESPKEEPPPSPKSDNTPQDKAAAPADIPPEISIKGKDRTKSLLDDDEGQDEVQETPISSSPSSTDHPALSMTAAAAQDDKKAESRASALPCLPESNEGSNVTTIYSTPATTKTLVRSKQNSVASSEGESSTPSIPSTVEWNVPAPLNLSKLLLSSPSSPSSAINKLIMPSTPSTPSMAIMAATASTPTPSSKMLMTPGSLTSDFASPEGRFLRRKASQPLFEDDDDDDDGYASPYSNNNNLDDDDVLSSPTAATTVLDVSDLNIPALFFEAKPDDSPYLATLEWEWWPWVLQEDALMEDSDSDDKVVLLHDEITQRLSQLDQLHRHVCQRLYKHVAPHAKTLSKTNQTALELVKNYRICQMYATRSQESLRRARYGDNSIIVDNNNNKNETEDDENNNKKNNNKNTEGAMIVGGIQGANDLLQTWDTQESYTKLQSLLEWIQHVYEREDALKQRIRDYDVRLPTALEECLSIATDIRALQEQLQEEPSLSRWTALTDMRARVTEEHPAKLTRRLHEWMESLTIATNAAWHHGGEEDNKEEDDDPHNVLDETRLRLLQALRHLDSPPADVAATMQTALLMQAQKAWGLALLDPTISDDDDDDEEYDKELLALSFSVQQSNCNQDAWISNLMTIRLEWEALQKFPAIYHKLCVLLCRVLYGAHSNYRLLLKLKLHSTETKEEQEEFCHAIYEQLLARRASIWNACIQTLERSLEEYVQHMAMAKETQKKQGESIVDDNDNEWWYREWEGLHDIWRLTQQFLSLRHEFGESDDTANDGTCVQERLETIFKHHLRSIHVEAMNNVGKLLYKEDWTTLMPLATSAANSFSSLQDDKSEPVNVGFEIQKVRDDTIVFEHNNLHFSDLQLTICVYFSEYRAAFDRSSHKPPYPRLLSKPLQLILYTTGRRVPNRLPRIWESF